MSFLRFLNKNRVSLPSVINSFANEGESKRRPHVPDFHEAPHYKGKLDDALEYFADTLGRSDDYMVRVMRVGKQSAACLFITTITDDKAIQDTLTAIHGHKYPRRRPKNMSQYLIERVLPSTDAVFMTNMYEMQEAVLSGDLVILLDCSTPAIVIGAKNIEHRKPSPPTVESASRGSQVAFVENLETNIGLLRSGLQTDTLHVKKLKVGYRSHTDVAILYIEDVANPVAVETVVERVNTIHVDVVTQSATIEQLIVDNHFTIFPLTRITQRIDSSARVLNEGKVVVLVDGDPTALLMPTTILDFFQTEEDYSHAWYDATFMRWLRFIAFVLAAFLPALYVAFVDFNPELLPKLLGIQIARSRAGVPFPAVIEVMIMQVVIEILREATLRMPKQMGQTIGIVGGLVVGEASVQAGLVSNILIIIVSLTAISMFVTPSYEFSTVIRLLSWAMIIAATMFGLYGVVLMAILILYHMASVKSFGISYLDPFNGEHTRDLLVDGILRIPVWAMDVRASHLHPRDKTRAADYEDPWPHPQLEKAKGQAFRSGKRRRLK